ncbi:MAG TPA: NADH-quinone oxidoreductase subunit M, partial [Chitinophagaceae bacterium]|nr:NADH-quinone oxidoreductase subunit M [Chitinophagaceae bacterium]
MLILLLILLPFFGGLLIWLLQAKAARGLALLTSLLTMCTALVSYFFYSSNQHWNELSVNHAWIETLGARFNMALHPGDGLALMMVLLTSIGFPFIFLYQLNKDQDRPKTFYSLMLWVQSGLLGVFLAKDALLFYIFWEVALIPVYFLASMYGGERRKAVSFKFFIYTFSGSLLMLLGLLYVYIQTPIHSFDWDSMLSAGKAIPATTQHILFWFMFVAFAIKMPVFPFHTWQPDAYEESAAPVTMVLSAFMVKMGLFAVVRWLMPVVPEAASFWMNLVIALSVCGIVYASLMALVQTNLKRMLAYSS